MHFYTTWRNGNIVGRINKVAVRWARLVLGWVTVFDVHNTLVSLPSHPGQLSLMFSAEREMSTGQRTMTLCGWGVMQDGSFHVWINVCVAGKNWHPEHFRDFTIKCYT